MSEEQPTRRTGEYVAVHDDTDEHPLTAPAPTASAVTPESAPGIIREAATPVGASGQQGAAP